jgi:CheY-like chemotaxis protein
MKKIMLVDDEKHVLRIMRLSLERLGYHIETYNNGQDACNALQNGQPDVLITDIQIPLLNGQELCSNITSAYPERAFLIIVLTSRTEPEYREWSSKIANLQFLEKPVSMKRLIEMLDTYFNPSGRD